MILKSNVAGAAAIAHTLKETLLFAPDAVSQDSFLHQLDIVFQVLGVVEACLFKMKSVWAVRAIPLRNADRSRRTMVTSIALLHGISAGCGSGRVAVFVELSTNLP